MKKMLKKTSAVEAEQEKFLQSSRYAKLPVEEKEAGKKEHIDDEAQQEEKGTALSDVSLNGEAEDAPEDIKRMAEGLRTGISESAANQNTDAAAGSIDLKI